MKKPRAWLNSIFGIISTWMQTWQVSVAQFLASTPSQETLTYICASGQYNNSHRFRFKKFCRFLLCLREGKNIINTVGSKWGAPYSYTNPVSGPDLNTLKCDERKIH